MAHDQRCAQECEYCADACLNEPDVRMALCRDSLDSLGGVPSGPSNSGEGNKIMGKHLQGRTPAWA